MGALGFRKRRAALVASVHQKDFISLPSKNIHGDPRRAARPEDESDATIFNRGLECHTIGVLRAQPERLARGARPQERVDRRLAVLGRAREERGFLLERDRHRGARKRKTERIERGDERLELPPEHPHRERNVERVLAESFEIRVVERRREGVGDDATQKREEPRNLSHATSPKSTASAARERFRGSSRFWVASSPAPSRRRSTTRISKLSARTRSTF